MPSLSEFVEFIVEKTGIEKRSLIEKDILLHKILTKIFERFGRDYLFKGGSCLVKCYFGYYRFSVDLDFTWSDQSFWDGLGKKRLRRKIMEKVDEFGSFLETLSKEMGLDFVNDPKDEKYFEFGGGSRMVTLKLWKNGELIKIQISFVERILFEQKERVAKTLLDKIKINKTEKVYFENFLNFYRPFKLIAYNEKEILCEKIRAILTRKKQKLRDFYDIFMLDPNLKTIGKLENEIIEKVKFALYYQKYRDALEKNKRIFSIGKEIIEDPFERNMFIIRPKEGFEQFLRNFEVFILNLLEKF